MKLKAFALLPAASIEKRARRRSTDTPLNAIAYLMAGFALLVAIAGCSGFTFTWDSEESDDPVEIRDDSFTVGPSPRLLVTSFNGRVTVNSSSNNTIRVQARLTRADRADYEVRQDGNTVEVKAGMKWLVGKTVGRDPGIDVEVTAPSSTGVELITSNGMIELRGMNESGTLRTSNGMIVMEDVSGDFSAHTSNGAIEVTAFKGSVDLDTSNGRISFSGELIAGGRNDMRTSNGDVDVTLQGTPSIRLDASTSNGTVTSSLPIVAASTGDTHLAGTLGEGEAELTISTSNGSVTIG